MREYIVCSQDTFIIIAKKFYGDESAANALAKFNKFPDEKQNLQPGQKLLIPSRIYILKSKEAQNNATTLNVSVCISNPNEPIVFFSPATQKYYIIYSQKQDILSSFKKECEETKSIAQKIIEVWKEKDFSTMLSKIDNLSKEIESFFPLLKTNPEKAIDEIISVTKHPLWKDPRFYVRPEKLLGLAEIKDVADQTIKSIFDSLKNASGDYSLDKDVMSFLCNNAHIKDEWPLKWNFSDVQSEVEGETNKFLSSVNAIFVRFLSGCGLGEKINAKEKIFHFEKNGYINFSFLKGQLSGEWFLPNEKGFNFFEIFGSPKTSNGKELICMLRCKISTKSFNISKYHLHCLASLPKISSIMTEQNQTASAQANAEINTQAKGKIIAELSWSPDGIKSFATIAKADLLADIKDDKEMSINYSEGKIKYSVPKNILKGLEGKGSIIFDVDPKEGIKLVQHIFGSILYLFLSQFDKAKSGFTTLVSAKFDNVFSLVEKKVSSAENMAKSFSSWFHECKIKNGIADGTWYIPDKNGLDLIKLIKLSPALAPCVKPNVYCYIRIKIVLSSYKFAQAGSQKSNIGDVFKGMPNISDISKASIPTSLNLAAGAGGNLAGYIEWRSSPNEEFKTLGEIMSMGAMSAFSGLSIAVPVAFEYKNGTLRGLISLKYALGLSSNAMIGYSASGNEAKAFVNHLFSSLNVSLESFLSKEKIEEISNIGSSVYEKAKIIDKNIDKKIDKNITQKVKEEKNKLFGKI
jgi:hypothetical protein